MLAGTIAAIRNNGQGIAGEASNVQILAIKITDAKTAPTALAAVVGILYAVNEGAKIINASWHLLDDSNGLLPLAILEAGRRGCVFVTAAGNYGSNNTKVPTLPASYAFSDMVVAMASDRHDNKCWFSNYGSNVDLAAPGVRVISTGLYYANPAYREYSGTSTAAAHISGAAALLLAIDDWTPRELREQLVASARPSPLLRGTCRAEGQVDLSRAIVGPFAVTSPTGGQPLTRGSPIVVRWDRLYTAPIVSSVEVSFIDKTNNNSVLAQFNGLQNNGQRQVTVPNQPTAQATVRVKCEQKNLYADSDPFEIL
jgi:subtilisin family serine protease